jgi:predicted HicB family RNase H-like nuclease
MASKKPKKKSKAGTVFFGGYLDESLHRVLKAEAEKADRTLNGEINHRLKLTVKTLETAE